MKNTRTPPYDIVNYTKYPCESKKKTLNAKLLFFLSSPRLISYLYFTWTMKKPKKILSNNLTIFCSWEQISIFTVKKLVKS